MSDAFLNTIVILTFTLVPITMILLQIFLAKRKKLVWGFVVPVLWSVIGATWIIKSNQKEDAKYLFGLFLLFIIGDLVLLGILALMRQLKKKKEQSRR
ncbi:hypothetical protein I5677_07500 [Mobilitalea sibirica]|uniref:Uncharacterized protein n=1 Tax=Mobilitalea sibirica TaxID=1462919 RepID=A0A8J7HDG2_9FIRM|nr:hypothetical protein [Mobilitalea sibirica]MBH1940729.1 hypothetical protein [Mobilitalea sibirica]